MTEDLSEEAILIRAKEMARAFRKASRAFFNKDIIRINVEEYVHRERKQELN